MSIIRFLLDSLTWGHSKKYFLPTLDFFFVDAHVIEDLFKLNDSNKLQEIASNCELQLAWIIVKTLTVQQTRPV